ncbi:hypothetical protein INR49_024627, partial [Caranx melampygus]
ARFKTRMEMNNLTFIHDDDLAELEKSLNIMSVIIYCLAFIFGVLGNGVVIWVTGFKMKKTVNTVWFLNLAVADFLFTAFLPLSVTYTALNFHWPFGNFMCKLNSGMTSLNMFASIYILVVISVDRCVSVVWPVWAQNHRNVRKASYVSLGVWVLALILSAPYVVFRDTAPSPLNEEYIRCFNNFPLSNDSTQSLTELRQLRHKAMTFTRFFLGFVVPFTVIVSSYAVIIHRLRRNRTLSSQSSRPFKIIIAVIITFFLCWTPFHIMQLIELVHFTVSPTFKYAVEIGIPITLSLAFVNSCLNPLLYVFMGQDFKDKVRKSILSVLETVFQEEAGVKTKMEKNNTDLFGDTYPSFVSKDSNMYSDDFAELKKVLNIFSVIVYCLVFVLGVLGNGVVIWVTGFKMKKIVKTVWFLNLAVADFLISAFLPLNVIHKALDQHWPFGNFMCKFHTSITFLNMFASVYILVVISVDRCVSVVWPVWAQNHRNVRKASYARLKTMIEKINLSHLHGETDSLHDNKDDNMYYENLVETRMFLNIFSIIGYCLAFVLGMLGNGVVIWVTGFKMKKTVKTVWFLNLAVADFLLTVCLPLTVTYLAMDYHWPFGNLMCKLHTSITFLTMFASVYILVVISVDRCVSVVWPVWAQNHRNVRRASYVSLGVWVLALTLSTPYFIFKDTAPSYFDAGLVNCLNNFSFSDDYKTPSVIKLGQVRHQAMTVTYFLLGFLVPFTVIVSCYTVIIHRLRRNRTLSSQSSRPFKIIAAVIITFFLCWAPFHIMRLLELVHFTSSDRSETLGYVIGIGIPIATSLIFVNSCMNPLLYVFVGQDFKDKVHKSILNARFKTRMEMNNLTFFDYENYSDDLAELGKSLNIMSIIIYRLAFIFGVLGNGVVIWVTGFKMKKTVNTVWFLNLAVADFLFTAFLPLSVTYTALGFHWPFGNFMCKLNSGITYLNMFASIYILVVISVDRCVSVVWPVWAQNHRNVRKASYVSLGVWVLALILSAPYVVFRDTAPSLLSEEYIICFNNFVLSNNLTQSVIDLANLRHQAMTLTRFFLGFFIPFTVIVSSYAVIMHRLRRNRTLSSQSSRPFKIIAAVIITFFLCWAPFHIMQLIELVHFTVSPTFEYAVRIGIPIATSLAFVNSCLNPLLYVLMGQDFKDKVRKSILTVLETVFQEEVSPSHTYTNSITIGQSKNDDFAELRKAFNIMSVIVYCLAFVLGVIGNGVVIWVTGFKMKKTVKTVWFLNLAVGDFLFTAFLALSVTYTALGFHWPFGNFMCKLNSGITSLNMFASVYILVVISMDRCVSVVWPVWAQNHRNVWKASYVSLGVWVLALILSAPYVVFRDTAPSPLNEEYINCFNNFALSNNYTQSVIELAQLRHQAMTLTHFFLGFLSPSTVIVSCYTVIIHRLRRNRTLSSQSSHPL